MRMVLSILLIIFATGCVWTHEVYPVFVSKSDVSATTADIIVGNTFLDEDFSYMTEGNFIFLEENYIIERLVTEREFKMFTDGVEQTLRDIQKELRLLRYGK